MKRYLLFIGHKYHPQGGMYDFDDDFDILEDAISHAKKDFDSESDWAHIFDTELKEEVWSVN